MIVSRPLGKYFSATIAKLRTFKESEHIEIDEDFRLGLRNSLLIQAGTIVQPQRTSFGERFSILRQYIPIIPSFLLLTAAAFSFDRFPVIFERDIVVPKIPIENVIISPVTAPEQPDKTTIQEKPAEPPLNTTFEERKPPVIEKPVIEKKTEPKIKKKKAPVKDKEYLQKAEDDALSIQESRDMAETRDRERRKLFYVPFFLMERQKTDRAIKPGLPLLQPASLPPPNFTGPYTQHPEIPPVPTPVLPPQPPVQQYFTPQTAPHTMSDPNLYTPPATGQYQQSPTTPLEEPKIYFKNYFPVDEQILLKNNFIPWIIKGKNVTYISIYEGQEPGFAIVDVHLYDGNTETYHYDIHGDRTN